MRGRAGVGRGARRSRTGRRNDARSAGRRIVSALFFLSAADACSSRIAACDSSDSMPPRTVRAAFA
ncbi:hypothetical protein WS62_03225 [Burkholderia sp. ABCPW 14]|nr:hypothetical protein WS62_03225 [Burkholderia sp. ABCPW 14]